MPVTIDINKDVLKRALEQHIASLKRSTVKQVNPLIVELVNKDVAALTVAIGTITETKR